MRRARVTPPGYSPPLPRRAPVRRGQVAGAPTGVATVVEGGGGAVVGGGAVDGGAVGGGVTTSGLAVVGGGADAGGGVPVVAGALGPGRGPGRGAVSPGSTGASRGPSPTNVPGRSHTGPAAGKACAGVPESIAAPNACQIRAG